MDALGAFACAECQRHYDWFLKKQEPNKNTTNAPWSKDQLQSLRAYQSSDIFLPYVCEKGHVMTPERENLLCTTCGQKQAWAYSWTIDGTWRPGNADANPTGSRSFLPPTPETLKAQSSTKSSFDPTESVADRVKDSPGVFVLD